MITPEQLDIIRDMLQNFIDCKIISKDSSEYIRGTTKKEREEEKYIGSVSLNSYQVCMGKFIKLIDYLQSISIIRQLIYKKQDPSKKEEAIAELNKVLSPVRKIFNSENKETVKAFKQKIRLFKKASYLSSTPEGKENVYKKLFWFSSYILNRHTRDMWWNIFMNANDESAYKVKKAYIERFKTKRSKPNPIEKPKKKLSFSDEEPKFDTDDMLEECKKIKIKLILK